MPANRLVVIEKCLPPEDLILDVELMLINAKTYYVKKSVIRQKSVEFQEIIKPYIIHLSEN